MQDINCGQRSHRAQLLDYVCIKQKEWKSMLWLPNRYVIHGKMQLWKTLNYSYESFLKQIMLFMSHRESRCSTRNSIILIFAGSTSGLSTYIQEIYRVSWQYVLNTSLTYVTYKPKSGDTLLNWNPKSQRKKNWSNCENQQQISTALMKDFKPWKKVTTQIVE